MMTIEFRTLAPLLAVSISQALLFALLQVMGA
jgi:hypothetical protein